jgi:hypothetical protein
VGVTFVNLACSGATIANLTSSNYGGIIKDAAGGPHQLLPQLRALRTMLGEPLVPETRSVDVLLATAGINDMGTGAGDLLRGCAILGGKCQHDLSNDIAGLRDSYDQLELAISANIRLGHAYFAGYPARIFTNAADQFSGCGFFNMTPADARWIYRTVESINGQTAKAAERLGWTFMPVTELFRNHGYCADHAPPGVRPGTPWFRPYLATRLIQGDDHGTAHPNQGGHEETARAASRIVRTDVPAPAPDVFDVRFLRVRVTDELHAPWPGEFSVSVQRRQRSACGHTTEAVTGLKLNSWNDVSANPCMRFHVRTAGRTVMIVADTYLNPPVHRDNPPQNEQRGRGHPTPVRPGPVLFTFERFLRRVNGWNATPPPGPGYTVQHFVDAHDNGRIEIEYEITRPQVAGPVR